MNMPTQIGAIKIYPKALVLGISNKILNTTSNIFITFK